MILVGVYDADFIWNEGGGIPLITEVPNLQLSPGFDVCSDTMRDHMNSWLLAMLGSHMPCYVFQDTIIMHPRHAAMLRVDLQRSYSTDYPWRPMYLGDKCPACFENFDLNHKCDNCGSGHAAMKESEK